MVALRPFIAGASAFLVKQQVFWIKHFSVGIAFYRCVDDARLQIDEQRAWNVAAIVRLQNGRYERKFQCAK